MKKFCIVERRREKYSDRAAQNGRPERKVLVWEKGQIDYRSEDQNESCEKREE